MKRQIRTIGLRNAIYVGQINDSKAQNNEPRGIGLLFDDMAITCLSSWAAESRQSSIRPQGPTLIIYPHRQILFTDQYPRNNQFKGFWCCIVPNLKVFGFGERESIAVLHSAGNVISKTKLINGELTYQKQINYETQQQKWKAIQQIISYKITQDKRTLRKFIQSNFINQINYVQGEQYFINLHPKSLQNIYGIINRNQGLAFTIKQHNSQLQVQNTGYYNNFEPKNQLTFGRKYIDQINSTSYKIYEGNLQTGQTYKFQFTDKRPSESYKTSRNYFRQATHYCNRYVQLTEADEIYKRLSKMTKQYIINIGAKYGQRIIQGSQQKFIQTSRERDRRYQQTQRQRSKQKQKQKQNKNIQTYRSNKYHESMGEPLINRQYNLNQAKAIIQSDINKKRITSDRKKGIYTISSPSKRLEDTPIYSYQYSERQPYKAQRSPQRDRANIKSIKYQYTYDEPQQQNNYHNIQRQKQRNVYAFSPQTDRYKVSSFALYPVTVDLLDRDKEKHDYMYIQKQKQLERQRQRQLQTIEKQRMRRRVMQRQINRDIIDLKPKIQKQIQRQNQLQRLIETQKRILLQKMPTFGQKQYEYQDLRQNYSPLKNQINLGRQSIANDNIRKRKYFQSYNYTQQKQVPQTNSKDNQSTSSFTRRQVTPVTMLLSQNFEPQPRQVSRSPIGSTRKPTTARKIYSYVD